MSKRIIIFIILSILLSFSMCKSNETEQLYCIANKVRVRETPSLDGKIIGMLSAGEAATILEKSTSTSKITIESLGPESYLYGESAGPFERKQYDSPWYLVRNDKKALQGWAYSLFFNVYYYPRPKQLRGIDRQFEENFSFCPIGWSRDGKIAFMQYRNFVYAEETPFPEFHVYDTAKQEFTYSVVGEMNLKDQWAPYSLNLHLTLNELGVIPGAGALKELPQRIKGIKTIFTSETFPLKQGGTRHVFYLTDDKGKRILREIRNSTSGHRLYKKILVSPFKDVGVLIVSYGTEMGRDFDLIGIKF